MISTRDVIFDEDSVFSGKTEDLMDNLMHSTLEEIAAWVRSVELPPSPQQDQGVESFYEDETITDMLHEEEDEETSGYQQGRKMNYTYPTPPQTPPPVALLAQLMAEKEDNNQLLPAEDYSRPIPWAAAFMAGTQAGSIGKVSGRILDKAQFTRMMLNGKKPHQSVLPEPPTCKDKLESHPLCHLWKEAEKSHLDSHREMKSWSEVPAKPVKLAGHQILDCMWVYTYKFDKHHQFQKCKARLVVRGDQQHNLSSQDTYAATLAGRSFRMLLSIAARFNLELIQYDVTNAFVHANLDREVYMKMPVGYRKPGTILQLHKALYGLRISPLLWHKLFTSTLKELGFQAIPHEPCCMIKDGIIIFFYVDDIIMAYHKQSQSEAETLVALLQQKFTFTGGKDLQWFLGVEVIRDKAKQYIWLSQAAYVDKISRLVDKRDLRHDTPMSGIELKPRIGFATPAEINKYQRKIGSLLYAAVTTRPDIAFATSRLARFLTNPGPEHQDAADRTLLYLLKTHSLCLRLGGGDSMQVASDASFADNTIDRKSSQGYAIKLFGGLIAWKANKQDTVTTSTTEAELLALSQVAKEAIFTMRLLNELKVNMPDKQIIIHCDNKQTIRLVTQKISQLQTKLRHVDIHNHWLRQEIQAGTISVKYIASNQMLADGLTKALPPAKWSSFLQLLGIEDMKVKISERENCLPDQEHRLSTDLGHPFP